jgi:hypothetical protein
LSRPQSVIDGGRSDCAPPQGRLLLSNMATDRP